MLREVGQPFVLEQTLTIMSDEPIDEALIRFRDAQRRLKMLAGQGEAMAAVMRGADDDEQRCRRAFEDFLEAPGVRQTAAAIVDVRHQCRPQLAVRRYVGRQTGALLVLEQPLQLPPQWPGLGLVDAQASRRRYRAISLLPKAWTIEKQSLLQRLREPAEDLQRNQLSADLTHGLGLHLPQRSRAIKELHPAQFQRRQAKGAIAQTKLVPDDEATAGSVFRGRCEMRAKLRTFRHGHVVPRRPGRGRFFVLSYSWSER